MKEANKLVIGCTLYVIGISFAVSLIWWKYLLIVLIQGTGVIFLLLTNIEKYSKERG